MLKTFTVSYLNRDGSGENHWVSLDVAFEDPETGRIRVKLDAVPVCGTGLTPFFRARAMLKRIALHGAAGMRLKEARYALAGAEQIVLVFEEGCYAVVEARTGCEGEPEIVEPCVSDMYYFAHNFGAETLREMGVVTQEDLDKWRAEKDRQAEHADRIHYERLRRKFESETSNA